MFCPKCGNSIGEDGICAHCAFDVSEIAHTVAAPIPVVEQSPASTIEDKRIAPVITIRLIAFSVVAIVVLAMSFVAASKIAESGLNILNIQSVGGKTLEEAYYFELGTIYAGYAMMARAVGVFFASVLLWLGLKK